jgi:phage virion morphogenesis protein
MNIFSRLAERVRDPRAALALMADYELRETESRFDREVDPEGNPWKELKPVTLRKKRGPSILTESGDLRGEVTAEIDRTEARIGTQGRLAYERIHQKGGVAGFGAIIPQRQYIGATEDQAEVYALFYLAHLRGLSSRTRTGFRLGGQA